MTLTEDFSRDGYLVAPNLLSAGEVQALRAETARLCTEHADTLGTVEGDAQKNFLAVHFPHKLSPLMHDMLAHPAIVRTLTDVIGPNVKCMQSMLFLKHAGKPGQAWHQDEAFIPTRDRSLAAAWIALDDAAVDNGCLWVLPGSHRAGIVWPVQHHDDPEYDAIVAAYGFPYTEDQAVPVEVAAGSVVFFHGYLLHKSLRNRRTSGFRRALVNHYMSAESLLPWKCQGTEDNRDVVLVAGTDPYAWKGTEERNAPWVRGEAPVPTA